MIYSIPLLTRENITNEHERLTEIIAKNSDLMC